MFYRDILVSLPCRCRVSLSVSTVRLKPRSLVIRRKIPPEYNEILIVTLCSEIFQMHWYPSTRNFDILRIIQILQILHLLNIITASTKQYTLFFMGLECVLGGGAKTQKSEI